MKILSNLRKILTIFFLLLLAASFLVYFRHQIYFSKGSNLEGGLFVVVKGENANVVASKLVKQNLISNRIFFLYYIWKSGALHEIKAGKYQLAAGATIPEIVKTITNPNLSSNEVEVMFREGLSMTEMAQLINDNNLPGTEFLDLCKNPTTEIKNKYDFLKDLNANATLEGYLFPDTYAFAKNASAQLILEKILNNFAKKIDAQTLAEIKNQKKSLREIIIMASIIEKEAGKQEDMGKVSSVFWNRLKIGQRLQSDATLEYVLGTGKIQHSVKETQFKSPYNTYQVAGLPPGPVSNPGLDAIKAAINPTQSDYLYFLTDLATKKTIFAKTFEEHVQNKAKYGL